MQTAQIIGISAAALLGGPALAQSQSDIVWPTYDQVQHAPDRGLSCPGLDQEIRTVTADVGLLRHAQVRVEEVLHSAFDLERYAGTRDAGGDRVPGGAVNGKEAYAAARGQIVASLHVAEQRRDWLQTLKSNCKPAP